MVENAQYIENRFGVLQMLGVILSFGDVLNILIIIQKLHRTIHIGNDLELHFQADLASTAQAHPPLRQRAYRFEHTSFLVCLRNDRRNVLVDKVIYRNIEIFCNSCYHVEVRHTVIHQFGDGRSRNAKSDVGKRRYDTAPISKEAREQYHDFIHQLLKGKKDWNGEETILHLSRHASEEYIDYCNKYIEKEIKESMCCCQDWGGKFHGLILRIACILHCADCCSRGVEPSDESVNHDTLVRSFSIAHYYRYQAIYGFSVNAPDGNIIKAEKIIQIFKTKNIKQGLKSDLYHACRCNLFPSAKDFYSALDTLAEYGYVAYEDVTAANNKKAQMVHVNPNI